MNLLCLQFLTRTTNCARPLKTSQKMCKYKLGKKETFDARTEIIGRCTCNKFENISNPHYRNKNNGIGRIHTCCKKQMYWTGK
jgi:hypothetical protein